MLSKRRRKQEENDVFILSTAFDRDKTEFYKRAVNMAKICGNLTVFHNQKNDFNIAIVEIIAMRNVIENYGVRMPDKIKEEWINTLQDAKNIINEYLFNIKNLNENGINLR